MGGIEVKETLVGLAEAVPTESQSCVSLLAGHGVLCSLRQMNFVSPQVQTHVSISTPVSSYVLPKCLEN